MVRPKDKGEGYKNYLIKSYLENRISAAEALEKLRKKSVTDGHYYYIGMNTRSKFIEVFKATEVNEETVMTAEEIEEALEERGLYIFCSPGGFITIRKVPENANELLQMRETDEEPE